MNLDLIPPQLRRHLRRVEDTFLGVLAAYLPGLLTHFPPVRVRLRTVPGWTPRLVSTGIVAICLVTLRPAPLWWLVLSFVLAAMLLVPGGSAPALAALAVGAMTILTWPEPSLLRTALTLLAVHAAAELGLIGGLASFTGRIELRALLVPLPRFAVVQAVAQSLAVLGALFAGARLELSVLPILGIVAVAGAAALWVPRLGPARD